MSANTDRVEFWTMEDSVNALCLNRMFGATSIVRRRKAGELEILGPVRGNVLAKIADGESRLFPGLEVGFQVQLYEIMTSRKIRATAMAFE